MEQIYKYTLLREDTQIVEMRCDSVDDIISIEEQRGSIVIYAIRDDNFLLKRFEFIIVGTGDMLEFDRREYKFLDTIELGGYFMFHIFCKEIN